MGRPGRVPAAPMAVEPVKGRKALGAQWAEHGSRVAVHSSDLRVACELSSRRAVEVFRKLDGDDVVEDRRERFRAAALISTGLYRPTQVEHLLQLADELARHRPRSE